MRPTSHSSFPPTSPISTSHFSVTSGFLTNLVCSNNRFNLLCIMLSSSHRLVILSTTLILLSAYLILFLRVIIFLKLGSSTRTVPPNRSLLHFIQFSVIFTLNIFPPKNLVFIRQLKLSFDIVHCYKKWAITCVSVC